jgi:hypothetical protein
MLATLAVTPVLLVFVPDEGEEEGKDDDIDPDRSSIGGKRSLSMSDLRLWVTHPGEQISDREREKGKEERFDKCTRRLTT